MKTTQMALKAHKKISGKPVYRDKRNGLKTKDFKEKNVMSYKLKKGSS